MNISDHEIQAYVDGELAPEDAVLIEVAIASDVMLAARVERERRLRASVRGAFDGALQEAPPARLLDLLQDRQARDAAVVPIGARRAEPAGAARWRVPAIALAASVAAVALFGAWRQPGGLVGVQNDAIVARGALASELDEALAGSPRDGARVVVGLTFRDVDGRVCRSFSVPGHSLAGIACRDARGWALPMLSRSAPGDRGELRQAGSGLPPDIAAAIDARMQGEAFDAEQERDARAAGWR